MKLTIIINEKLRSTITTSEHKENEIMNDIIRGVMEQCNVRLQKYIITLSGGKDNGFAKLSSYNKKVLNQPINVVLEECFSDFNAPCKYVKNMDCVVTDTVTYSSCGICNFNPNSIK